MGEGFWVAGLVVLFAAFVQGVAGFAFGILSMALLTLLWDPQRANVIVTLLAMYSIAYTLWSVRRAVRWPHVLLLVGGALVGLPLGTRALISPDTADLLRYLVALTCLLVAAQNWFAAQPRPGSRPATAAAGLLAGVAGGFLSGAVSTSGPPVLWYIYRRPWTRDEYKASTLAVFLLTGAVKLGLWCWHDAHADPTTALLTGERLLTTVCLLPLVVLGSAAGVAMFRRIHREQLRRWVCVLLVVTAATTIATTLQR